MKLTAAIILLASLSLSTLHAVKVKSKAESALGAGSGMPSPWLSLLAQSWTLAGTPSSQKETTLQHMADDIVKLASNLDFKADPAMVTAVNSIRALLEDMIGSINSTNIEAQRDLDEKEYAVRACTPPNSTAQPHLQTPTPQPTQHNVTQCRDQQQILYDAYQDCLTLKEKCKGNELCCEQVIQPEGGHSWCPRDPKPSFSFGSVSLCYSAPQASQCSLPQLSTELAYWQGLLNDYDAKLAACESAMAGCPTLPATVDCTDHYNALVNQTTHCDTIQHNFENPYCTYAQQVETSWDNYTTCYNTNMATLSTAETAERTNLPGRQQQYRAILRIHCLLDVLLENTTDMTPALEACIAARYNVSSFAWLNISFPTEDPTFPQLQTCATQMWEPGSASFNTYFFNNHSLISDSLAETHGCVAKLGLSHCTMRTSVTR